MTRSLRGRGLCLVALLAVLAAGTVIPTGCGSPPAAEEEGSGVTVEAGEGTEEGAVQEGAAAEPAAPEPGPAEAPPAQAAAKPTAAPSSKPAAEAAPGTSGVAPAAVAAAAAAAAAGAEPAAPSPAVEALPAAAPAVDWVGTAQKWVPIFSLETEGVYLGAAQVAGPTSQVEKVKGVAELRLNFKNIGRIYTYVPVSTISLTKLARVQGVSVWAIGDLQLAEL
ncbi:MAG: hypothetical protein JSV79_06630 [Armatimonadota bacterium]|nr:MAG: hypothetical protein JSV79_06630 [Armatimonadota bacterium]